MEIVAGPSGSGKTTFLFRPGSAYDSFNSDERRKELNGGSSQNIPAEIRQRVAAEHEVFIEGHIRAGQSFRYEATLANEITLEQAERAKERGFWVHLLYVATEIEITLERVDLRRRAGGHWREPPALRESYARSMENLVRAIRAFDIVLVYDNSVVEARPRLVLEAHSGEVVYRQDPPPPWLRAALAGPTGDNADTRVPPRNLG